MSKRKVHIVTYTHWDREFRWEFERTRMCLVDCIDHLLEIFDSDPDYKSFLMDGQLTLIEDYLEIRPENRGKIEKLAKEGRLELGPWFTLADCASVQGECVLRNLRYGINKSKEYGSVLNCGYNVFSFGQIGQLPQIYQGFGIDSVIFYKYMDPKKSKYHEFIWEAPDGTKVLASRLGKEARWNFFFAGHIPIVYDKDAWDKDWQYKWGELGKVFHTADKEGYGWFYNILDPETGFHKKNLRLGMDRALKTVEGTAVPESVLMFEGTDFTEPHPLTSQIIKAMQEEYKDELEIVHSTLENYLSELKEKLKDRTDLDVVCGPLRDGPVGAIHTDVFTTHPEILIENSHAENKLLRYAEPLSTLSWIYGMEQYPKTYLDKTWKLLFQSHAHDSIHGLGPKTLGEGEVSRLKQASVIAQGLERRGLQNINKEIDTSGIDGTDYFLSVHNPSAFARSEVVEAYVDIPRDVKLNYVIITEIDGTVVAVQEAERSETRAGIYHPRSRNMPFYSTKVHLYFEAKDIPAFGYRTFCLKWVEKNIYPYPHEDWDAPRILANNMLTGSRSAENEFISVEINADGTANITDKATGKQYSNLNSFLETGDIGNMWMSDQPANDLLVSSIGCQAQVGVVASGPLAVVFSAKLTMLLPAEFDFAKKKRSKELVEMPVEITYTLRKGSPYLEVETSIDNTAKDHYLKVCFPTKIENGETYAEGSFMVTKYPIKPSENGNLRGNELARHPAQLWYDVTDGKNSFAVLTDAAKDYEILEQDKNTAIAMGLVRGTRLRIACDNRLWMEYPGDESAQSLRKFDYRYALMPHVGLWDEARLYENALSFNTPMHICQFGKQNGILPTEKSFFNIDNTNVVLSSVKKADDRNSAVICMYNPTDKDIETTLSIGFDMKEAYLLKLNEERAAELKVTDGKIPLNAGHGKIICVELAIEQ